MSEPLDQGLLEEELFDVKKKWYSIGLQLKVPDVRLDEIEGSCNGDYEVGLRRMVQQWRRQINPSASWPILVKALRTRTVNESILASNLKDRYVRGTDEADSQQQLVRYGPSAQAALSDAVLMRPDEVPDPEVQRKIGLLHQAFQELRMNVYAYIEDTKPDLKEFAVFISSPPPSWKRCRSRNMRDIDLDRIMDPKMEYYQMFIVVNKYANWYNYEMIDGIVRRYGNPELKGQMCEYRSKLEEFESNTSTDELKHVPLALPQPDSVAIIGRLPHHNLNQFSAHDVRMLKHTYTNEAGMDDAALRTYMIKESSVEIIFLVPIALAPYLMVTSASKLLTSQNPLPVDMHERCVHMICADDMLRLMGKTTIPPSVPRHSSSESYRMKPHDPPVFRSVFSSSSITSEASALQESFSSIDPTSIQVFHNKVIMNGDNAVVCKARLLHLPCAAKYIHGKLTDSSAWQLERFESGCKILQGCQHPNIVTFLGTYHDNKLGSIMLMELMDQSLKEFLDKHQGNVPLHVQLNICGDVAHGMEYLHARNIIHGNLTATNVLLKDRRAKISGAVSLQLNTPDVELSLCPGAAESLPRRTFSHADYDEAIDCFSFGVLAIHIATRETPQPHPQSKECSEIQRYERSLKRLDGGHPMYPLIIECLSDKGSDRPSAAKLCQELSDMCTSSGYHKSMQADSTATKIVNMHIHWKVLEKAEENAALRKQLEDKQREFKQKNKQLRKLLQDETERAEELQAKAKSNEESMKEQIDMLCIRNQKLLEKASAASKEADEYKSKLDKMRKCQTETDAEKERMRKAEKEKSDTMHKKMTELEAEKADFKSKLEESDRNYAKFLAEVR